MPIINIRLSGNNYGTVWDSLFTVSENGDHTTLMLIMDAREPQGKNLINLLEV